MIAQVGVNPTTMRSQPRRTLDFELRSLVVIAQLVENLTTIRSEP
jgi:hypothetical protein